MDNNNSILGKRVKVIYDDGHDTPAPKEGIIKNSDDDFIYILNSKDIIEGLLKSRIIRIEVLK